MRYHMVMILQSGKWLPVLLRKRLRPCSGYFCPQYGGSTLFRNKLKLCLSTPRSHIGETEVWLHSLLTLRYMEVSGQHHAPAALISGKYPGTQWTGGRVGPKTGLDVLEKRQPHFLCWDSNPGPSSPYRRRTRSSGYEIPHCGHHAVS